MFISWEECRSEDNRFLCQGRLTGLFCWVTPPTHAPVQVFSLGLFSVPREDSSRLLPERDNNPYIAKSRVLLVQSLQKENYQSSARVGEKQSGYFTTSENFQSILIPCCFFFMSLSRVLRYRCSCNQISPPASFSGSFLFLLSVLPLVQLF